MLVSLDNSQEERALGIWWDVSSDSFSFKFDQREASMTKRGILKVTSSIFDPLGFMTPFVLRAKVLLQELWRQGIGWDDTIEGDIIHKWKEWMTNANSLADIKIGRCYTDDVESAPTRNELHIFGVVELESG